MRRLPPLIALLVSLLPLGGAIAVVQPTAGLPVSATQCTGTATTCDYLMPTQPVAGNAIVVSVSMGGVGITATSVTETPSSLNTYASTTKANTGSSTCSTNTGSGIQLWYATNITTAASFTIRATVSSGSAITVFAAEYSGVASPNASALDKQVQGCAASGTALSVASTTATNANSLYVAAMTHDGSGTVSIAGGGTFTERGENENTANEVQGYEDLISSAAQTGPFTVGTTSAWADTMAIFKPAGLTATPQRMLLGVGGVTSSRPR